MKKSILFTLFAVFLMTGMCFPAAALDDNLYPASSLNLAWSCTTDDSLEYTITNNFAGIISDQIPADVWNETNAWLADMNSSYTDAEALAAQILGILVPPTFGFGFDISSMTGYKSMENNWDGVTNTTKDVDIINATVKLQRSATADWQEPKAYIEGVAADLAPIALNLAEDYMNVTFNSTQRENMTAEMVAGMTEGMGPNLPFELAVWEDNENKTVPIPAETASTPMTNPFAAIPMPAAPNSLLVLPDAFKWDQIKLIAESLLNSTLNMTWTNATNSFGFSQVTMNARSIAIVVDVAEALANNVSMVGMYMTMIQMAGYNITEGTFTLGIEWNSKGLLTAVGLYVDGTAQITLDDLITGVMGMSGMSGVSAPEINSTVPVDMSMTMAAPGITPPSKDQITSGDIGDNREGAVPDEGFSVDGFSVGIVGALGILSVAFLIKKRRS